MAAVTPTLVRHLGSLGPVAVVLARFADTTDDADTWASAMDGVITAFVAPTSDPGTQTNTGIHVSHSAGTFTFYLPEDNLGFDLIVFKAS